MKISPVERVAVLRRLHLRPAERAGRGPASPSARTLGGGVLEGGEGGERRQGILRVLLEEGVSGGTIQGACPVEHGTQATWLTWLTWLTARMRFVEGKGWRLGGAACDVGTQLAC